MRESHKAVVLDSRPCIRMFPQLISPEDLDRGPSPATMTMTTINPASAKKTEPPKKLDFEYSLTRLEEIVGKLESANLSLTTP